MSSNVALYFFLSCQQLLESYVTLHQQKLSHCFFFHLYKRRHKIIHFILHTISNIFCDCYSMQRIAFSIKEMSRSIDCTIILYTKFEKYLIISISHHYWDNMLQFSSIKIIRKKRVLDSIMNSTSRNEIQ